MPDSVNDMNTWSRLPADGTIAGMPSPEDPHQQQSPPGVRPVVKRGAFPTPRSDLAAAEPYIPDPDPGADQSNADVTDGRDADSSKEPG
jgi:hypothetical protein